jgi:hypothetical protein
MRAKNDFLAMARPSLRFHCLQKKAPLVQHDRQEGKIAHATDEARSDPKLQHMIASKSKRECPASNGPKQATNCRQSRVPHPD